MEPLLKTVEAFIGETQMSPTAFGAAALGDRHFVRQLRAGRRCWPETEEKVRAFIRGIASPATCTGCDRRLDDVSVRSCGKQHCPHAQKEAA